MYHEELWWVVRDLIELVQGAMPSRVHHREIDPPEHQALRSRGAISGHQRQSVAIISDLRRCTRNHTQSYSKSHPIILAITLNHTRNHTQSCSQSHSIALGHHYRHLAEEFIAIHFGAHAHLMRGAISEVHE